MPSGMPTAGFKGFHSESGQLLPGVQISDYLDPSSESLSVPTIAVTDDMEQISVRMSYMEKITEPKLKAGERFAVCSSAGAAGWTPLMPNKFSETVLKPLMAKQQASTDFKSFWSKYLPSVKMPKVVQAAHGSLFSVSRAQILQHPKNFYEALLAEVSSSEKPYQALFLEYMWWYIFHPTQVAPCVKDLGTMAQLAANRQLQMESSAVAPQRSADAADAPQRRKLAYGTVPGYYAVLKPKLGDEYSLGSVMTITYTDTVDDSYQHRIELWRFGNFETRLADYTPLQSLNWLVAPGPVYLYGSGANVGDVNRTFGASALGYIPTVHASSGDKKAWNQKYILTPGDRYTIRVCPSLPEEMETCDDTFGESGEFSILPALHMQSPQPGGTYYVKGYEPTSGVNSHIQITWTSYYMGGAVLTLKLWNVATGILTWSTTIQSDDGGYTFYVPPDMASGSYRFQIVGTCNTCAYASTGTIFSSYSGTIKISGIISSPPPPSPAPPPQPPAVPWEVPIIKAFRESFGTDGLTTVAGVNHDYSSTSTISGQNNCAYVCAVYNSYGRRRLLFGGLQYAANTEVVGCTPQQQSCGCCNTATG